MAVANQAKALDRGALNRIFGSLLVAAPLLFGVPVLLGIAISVFRLTGTAYPNLGWATTVNSDAEMLYLGHTIYQNPAHGYTGLLYTPLFAAFVSVLLHVHLWNGWSLLVTIGAGVALIVLAARIAYLPVGSTSRLVRVLSAVGMGGIAYWLVSSMELSLLDEARPDQPAWALALFGLVTVAGFGPAPSRRRVALAVVLISAALWTKQTTFVIAGLALAWVWALVAFSALARKAAWLFTAALAGVNVVVLLVLNLLTGGWELYFNFEMGLRHALFSRYGLYVTEGLQAAALAAVLAGALWLACGLRGINGLHRLSPRSRAHALLGNVRALLIAADPAGRRILLLALYVPLGFVSAVYCMRKQGTSDNEFIGVVWALGLLAAAGWRQAQRHASTAAAAGVCIVLGFVLAQLAPIREVYANASIRIPALEDATKWGSVPPELLRWARAHTLYLPAMSDLNVPNGGPLYPDYYDIVDLLAAGNQPMYLVRALLDRRFDSVGYFGGDGGYASGYGKWEENYLWKLDAVIAARYVASPEAPAGVLVRRAGPERDAWMRDCFGPFAMAEASFRIRRGGGFWCSFVPGQLALVATPAALSEVVTTRPVHVGGSIGVSFGEHEQAPAKLDLVLAGLRQGSWTAQMATLPGSPSRVAITTYLGGVRLGSTEIATTRLANARRVVRVALVPTGARPRAPLARPDAGVRLTVPAAAGAFALVASRHVAVNLSAAHLRG
jgi:hypothetical protein